MLPEIEVRSPATGDLVGTVPNLDAAAVDALVARARAAQPAWSRLPFGERARLLRRYRERLVARADEVAELSVRETGKLAPEALFVDVLGTAGVARWCARRARAVLGRRRVPSGFLLHKRCYVVREPYGVIGVISAWNWPVLNGMRAVLPAIAAGNSVVMKPSEVAPLSALLQREIATEAGWPEDIFLIATGAGDTGRALVASALDKISFTGGVETGRRIAQQAAQRLLPVSLELGGSDAAIVLRGADLARAASTIVTGTFYNAGQNCTSLERVYVEASIYDEFLARVVEATGPLRVGAGDAVDIGCITTAAQLTKIEEQVNDAVAQGARVLVGGRRLPGPGRHFAPTVLVDVRQEMDIIQLETFGPVLPVVKVRDAAEALRLANDSSFGLGSSIWGPKRLAERLVPEVRAGMTLVNDAVLNALVPALPFGGIGESGTGRVHGDDGLREMSWARSVMVDRGGGAREAALLYPVDRLGRAGALAAVRLLAGRGRVRLAGLGQLLRHVPRLLRRGSQGGEQ
ncbi:MAG: aldehyde dehydrogenase family protein [Gemmatimonadetes bacterium]|nr:aldehyde dehydrogenase family protein [Gemmatimonadota bacterium]